MTCMAGTNFQKSRCGMTLEGFIAVVPVQRILRRRNEDTKDEDVEDARTHDCSSTFRVARLSNP